jgi:hypothetical protein
MADVVAVFPRIVFAIALVSVLYWKRREIAEAIENFRNNFPRGGPRTPTHPSPAGDSALLTRRRPKVPRD